MQVELKDHISELFNIYTSNDFYENLLSAKEFYFSLTGKINEEDDDFEARMSAFNEWYLFQYIPANSKEPFAQTYAFEKNLVGDFERAFKNVNHSVFEHTGNTFSGCITLKDVLHDTKVTLVKNHSNVSVMKGDIFIGRTMSFKTDQYLLDGMCLLPKESKNIVKKECKIVRKLKNSEEESKFLFFTESLKTKWSHYGHVDVSKIFVYPERKK